MSARDDLADLIEICADSFSGADLAYREHYKLAEEIIAAGFHRDRTITTAEELDALPDGSVVMDSDSEAWQRQSGIWLDTDGRAARSAALVRTFGPFTVLHEGASDE